MSLRAAGHHRSACLGGDLVGAAVGSRRHFDAQLVEQGRRRDVRVPHSDGLGGPGGGAVRRRRRRGRAGTVELVAAERVVLLLDDGAGAAVGARVLGEVVGACEALAARRTRELLLARVRPQVPLQLVRASEPAAQPRRFVFI